MKKTTDRISDKKTHRILDRIPDRIAKGTEGFITYTALYGMLILLCMGLMTLKITGISLGTAKDEMAFVKAHYDAERGARWFAAYCKDGNTWDMKNPVVIEDSGTCKVYITAASSSSLSSEKTVHIMSYGIEKQAGTSARVHIYVERQIDGTMKITDIKPY